MNYELKDLERKYVKYGTSEFDIFLEVCSYYGIEWCPYELKVFPHVCIGEGLQGGYVLLQSTLEFFLTLGWDEFVPKKYNLLQRPEFTQEMCDRGDTPPVGSVFVVDGDEECDSGYCTLICVGNHFAGGVIAEQMGNTRKLHHITGRYKTTSSAFKELADDVMELLGNLGVHEQLNMIELLATRIRNSI